MHISIEISWFSLSRNLASLDFQSFATSYSHVSSDFVEIPDLARVVPNLRDKTFRHNPLGAYMAGTLFLNKLKCFLTMMGKTDLFAVLCVDRLGIQDRCTMVASDVSC